MLLSAVGHVVPDVLKDHSASFIFRVDQPKKTCCSTEVTAWELSVLEICNMFIFYAGRTL
jgi:hypothetical protein